MFARFLVLTLLTAAAAPAAILTGTLAVVENRDGLDLGLTGPWYVGAAPNNLIVFRFDIPNAQFITQINDFRIFGDVRDDGEGDGGDEGTSVFINRGANSIFVASGGGPLGSSAPFDFFADPLDFAAIQASIQNNGRIPIVFRREFGDFEVVEVNVEVDAELAEIPEPATFGLAGFVLAGLVCVRRRVAR
jgi:hypothetical protein